MKKYLFSELIEEITELNTELLYGLDDIVGVTIEKGLIPTIANLTKTELNKFYIVKPDTFVFNPRTHGVRLGMGYNDTENTYITSWNNVAFKVKDEARTLLNPEYLWLYFNRTEWDRETNYHAWGSSTIVFSWNTFRNLSIKLPEKEVQDKIVRQYKVIKNRIKLKKQINDNLVAIGTASIQKNVGRGALINLTEAEMDRLTFPKDFKVENVSEFCIETKSGSTPSRTTKEYWKNGTISWVKSGEVHNNITLQTEEYITPLGLTESSTKLLPKDTVLMAMYGVTAGEVGYLAIEATTNQAICGMICHSEAEAAYLYFSLIQSQAAISRLSNGGAQDNLSKNFIDNIKIVVPPSKFIEKLNLAAIVEQMTLNTKEIILLEELQATVLAQLSSR